jgi:hypothetical protein
MFKCRVATVSLLEMLWIINSKIVHTFNEGMLRVRYQEDGL